MSLFQAGRGDILNDLYLGEEKEQGQQGREHEMGTGVQAKLGRTKDFNRL
jgi:hypothetical protein